MIVLDASAVGALLLEDLGTEFAATVGDTISANLIRAPAHWSVEVMNLLVKADRNARLRPGELTALWQRAEIVIAMAQVEVPKVDRALLEFAGQTGITPRDAAYVELALRAACPVCTGDKPMRRVCADLGIDVIAPVR